jgi:hypothetical protein
MFPRCLRKAPAGGDLSFVMTAESCDSETQADVARTYNVDATTIGRLLGDRPFPGGATPKRPRGVALAWGISLPGRLAGAL